MKEIEIYHECKDIIVYKKFFIIFDSLIRIFQTDNYQLFKYIDIAGAFKMIYLKDNYLIGLVNQYFQINKKNEKEENEPTRDLIVFKPNF